MVREVFTRQERRDRRILDMQVKRETMTPAEIGKAMYRAAWEAIDARGAVEIDDFLRANIPEDAIVTRSETILAKVIADRAAGKDLPVVAVKGETAHV